MNKLNRKAAETDLMDMKLVPLSEVAEGFCRHRKNNGEPCKRRAVVMGVCPSHLQSIGGHIFVTDSYDPEYQDRKQKENFSYCRACGELEGNGHALELCPVRRANPGRMYPPSPNLPNRLQYQFAKPERTTVALNGKRINATCCGPFSAYRIKPDAEGLNWEILHLPSRSKVAHLDSEEATIKTMRKICHEGVDLDFTDPMRMNHDSRFYINFATTKIANLPGGILAWTAAKAYYRTEKETHFYWMKDSEKIECWGPFGFVAEKSGVSLHRLDCPHGGAFFWVPSHKTAVALSKTATALNLNWNEKHSRERGSFFDPETLRGIAKLTTDFQGVNLRSDLWQLLPPSPLPQLPSDPKTQPTEVSIATSEGPRSVLAYIVADYFAIHRPLNAQERWYVLTHLPTGYQIATNSDIQACLNAALELAALGNWNVIEPDLVASRFKLQTPKELKALQKHNMITSPWSITVSVGIK
jgi:hypothetical protein